MNAIERPKPTSRASSTPTMRDEQCRTRAKARPSAPLLLIEGRHRPKNADVGRLADDVLDPIHEQRAPLGMDLVIGDAASRKSACGGGAKIPGERRSKLMAPDFEP